MIHQLNQLCYTKMKKDQLQQKRMEEHQSWSQVQSKVERAQKINGILNVFGVYDHTNDQMYTHSYRNKTGKQFLDFIKRINKKYASIRNKTNISSTG